MGLLATSRTINRQRRCLGALCLSLGLWGSCQMANPLFHAGGDLDAVSMGQDGGQMATDARRGVDLGKSGTGGQAIVADAGMAPGVGDAMHVAPVGKAAGGSCTSAADCALDLYCAGRVCSALPTSGLIGDWRFDEGTGTTTVDRSGNANTGTLKRTEGWGTGYHGSCLAATDQIPYPYVAVAPSRSIDGVNDAMTITAWMQTDGSGYDQTILSRRKGTGRSHSYEFAIVAGKLRFTTESGEVASAVGIMRGGWIHVAVTYDGSRSQFFKNGAAWGPAQTIAHGPAAPDSNVLILGGSDDGTMISSTMNGRLDEVHFYGRPLSPEEIEGLAR